MAEALTRYEFSPPAFSATVRAIAEEGGPRVSKFDRYMLSQLMMLFGFFSLVLVAVYWVNRAVLLFNHLISDGQSLRIFLEFTLLSLPYVIKIMLPASAFAGTVYVTNRMMGESELVVMQAAGQSAFRLARPVLVFAAVVALLITLLAQVLVPVSRQALAERSLAMAQNISARFLSEGKFLHPAAGVTLFIRRITPQGEMEGIFLSDARAQASRTTYSARRALLVTVGSGPKLVMFDGMAQHLDLTTNRLSVTRFKDFTYDLGALIPPPGGFRRGVAELDTGTLLRARPADIERAGSTRAQFLYEGNARLAAPLNAMAATMIGFAVMLLAGFSRFGNWRQIILGVLMLMGMQLLIDWTGGFATRRAIYAPLVYLPAAVGGAAAALMLWWSDHPRRAGGLPVFRRRVADGTASGGRGSR